MEEVQKASPRSGKKIYMKENNQRRITKEVNILNDVFNKRYQ